MAETAWPGLRRCGIKSIDDLHAEILAAAGRVARAADDNDPHFHAEMLRLHDVVARHFADEERVLATRLSAPQAESHAREHAHLLRVLADACDSAAGVPLDHGTKLALSGLLRRWLIKEITEDDAPFLAVAAQRGAF